MPVTRRHFLFGLAGLAAAAAFAIEPGFAATGPEAYVQKVGNSVIAAANSGSQERFRSILRQNADIPAIALFSLGQYRKNLPAGKRQEYYRLVERSISNVFVTHANKLKGQSLSVSGSREASGSILVESRLQNPNGGSTPVIWRLLKRGGGYKIFDVNVDGVWLANTQRTNFTSVLRKSNGNIDALLNHLRQ
jgi:phospholipid transport system substrate-binding protein